MKGRRVAYFFVLFLGVFLLFPFSVSATQTEEAERVWERMPDGYGEIGELLPDGVREELSDELFAEDAEAVGKALGELLEPKNLLKLVAAELSVGANEALTLLARLCGLLMISAILGRLQRSLGSDALAGAVRFCTTVAVFSAILHLQLSHLQSVQVFFERLRSLMGATIPVMGTVWAMGGNVTTATAGTGTLYVFLTVCESLCARTVLPIGCFCTALALCNTLAPEAGMRGIASSVKKIYTFTMGLMMTLLLSCLGAQTTLTAAADTTAARAAKLVSSNVIPIVGGSVGETLRTVGAGVQYLKSVVGIGGIVLLGVLVLPTLLSLILTRLVFLLGIGVADILGCEDESRLLSEVGNIYGCMLAAVAMSAVMFIFAIVIFIKTVVAVG